MSLLTIQGLDLERGGNLILNQLSLDVEENEILGLIGPSGSGKTTLLYGIAGLLDIKAGGIFWQGRDMLEAPVHKRGFGIVFQDHLLFPHKNVAENIAFGLRLAGWGTTEIKNRVVELLELLGLAGMEKRKVQSLSGGQAQRVSLGRALAPRPGLLLLDEPLAALDQTLRDALSKEIRQIIKSQGIPAIYVTHDLREVFFTADRLALMRDGKIHSHGTPSQLRNNPRDSYTANFFGLTNQFEVEMISGTSGANTLVLPWGKMEIDSNFGNNFDNKFDEVTSQTLPASQKYKILILPEAISLATPGTRGGIPAKVISCRFLGSEYQVQFQIENGAPESEHPILLTANLKTELPLHTKHHIQIYPKGLHILS